MITGGVRGIGFGIAVEFAKQGADLLLCYRSNDEAAEKAAKELAQYGTKVLTAKGDVCDEAFAESAVKQAAEEFGRVDILVNNAGITNDKLILRMSKDDFTKVIDTNLVGAFNFTKYAAVHMSRKKSGRIINLSSVSGVRGNAGQANYSASKAGIIGLTKTMARELASRGITVNGIAPGFVDTEMTQVLSDEVKEAATKQIPLGHFGKPEDIANMAAYLASEKAAYITGQIISVDGGMAI